MPKAKADVTPEVATRAKKMRESGKSYKEIATAFNFASEKVAWHVVNSAGAPTRKAPGKAPGKASGKASKRPVAGGKPKAQPKAQKAPSASVASPRTTKKAPAKASKPNGSTPDTARAQEEATTAASSPGSKPLNMLAPHGGDRPVARPADEVRPVPKPKDRKSK